MSSSPSIQTISSNIITAFLQDSRSRCRLLCLQLYHSFSISRGKNLEFFLHCSTFSRDHLQMLRFRIRWEYCFSFSAQIFRFSITLSDIITNGLEIVELSRLGQQIYLDLAWWHIDIDTRYLSICRWHQMVGGLFYESVGNLDRRPFDAQTQLFNFQLRHFSVRFWFWVSLTFHFSSRLQGGRMCKGRTELAWWLIAINCVVNPFNTFTFYFQPSFPVIQQQLLWGKLKRTKLEANTIVWDGCRTEGYIMW